GQIYKDRLASEIDYIYELTVSAQQPAKFSTLKKFLKPHLTALNSGKFSEFHLPSYESSTRKIQFLARNWLFLIRTGGLFYVFNRASNPNETVYRVKDGSINLAGLNSISLNRRCLRDLLDYEPDGFGPTKPAFLRSC